MGFPLKKKYFPQLFLFILMFHIFINHACITTGPNNKQNGIRKYKKQYGETDY